MGPILLLSLGLLMEPAPAHPEQIAQSILGPDGSVNPRLAPRTRHPSLEEQLRRRRQQQGKDKDPENSAELPPVDQPATKTEELLSPEEKKAAENPDLPEPKPWLRMNLGLAPAKAKARAGSVRTWRFEPGVIWQASLRLTDPQRNWSFWAGIHMATWNGTARSSASFARFSSLYAGPLFAFDWPGSIHQTLSFGMAGSSRQADRAFPGESLDLSTQTFSARGGGPWLSYDLGFRATQNFEWQSRIGVQNSSRFLLSYLSLGVSLWTD